MSYFKELDPPGQVAILVQGGVFKQVPLYTRNGYLFARTNGGFVRLSKDGATSHPAIRIESLVIDSITLCADRFGRLCDATVSTAVPLPGDATRLLLGAPE